MTVPPEAITAAESWARSNRVMLSRQAIGSLVEAAAPLIVADVLAKVEQGIADGATEVITQAVGAERDRLGVLSSAERDLVLADLGDLLDALGLGRHARPQTPHEVMQMAIARVRKLRGAP